ncbi:MAG TPA: mechanosensitive ion channel family protein [Anaerohalosphaeraceae bacterium]|nr:mechanosensitive ion channel family protein [Anaerohalosphaeraceae bacterium]HRT51257.1 mechanosensitive ion channel family protein [Anaerohalosphaeraceae bacterium]HRT87776.1 mechanosensitive ion channel family protein [Anaerohalosphaeraceae bacterium]
MVQRFLNTCCGNGTLALADPNLPEASGIFSKPFYGNTLLDWLESALVIIAAVVLGKVIYWLIGKTIKRAAAHTRTNLDDILVDMAEEPFVLGVVIAGIWYGLQRLTLSETADLVVNKSAQALLILDAAWLITRIFDSLVKEYLIPLTHKTDSDLDDHIVSIIRKGVKIAVWIIAVIMAMDNAGLDVYSILAGLGIGGLAFALAAKDVVGNFFGSIAIFLDKPFKVGDRVQVCGYDGVVTEVGLRSTRIRTRYEGRIVSIPNMAITEANIVNVDSEPARQVFAVYRLTPDMDEEQIELAMQLLRQIVEADSDTMEKVVTGFVAITEYSRDIMLLYWIKPEASNLKTRTRINLQIIKQFKKHNIELVKANPVHAKVDEVQLL